MSLVDFQHRSGLRVGRVSSACTLHSLRSRENLAETQRKWLGSWLTGNVDSSTTSTTDGAYVARREDGRNTPTTGQIRPRNVVQATLPNRAFCTLSRMVWKFTKRTSLAHRLELGQSGLLWVTWPFGIAVCVRIQCANTMPNRLNEFWGIFKIGYNVKSFETGRSNRYTSVYRQKLYWNFNGAYRCQVTFPRAKDRVASKITSKQSQVRHLSTYFTY